MEPSTPLPSEVRIGHLRYALIKDQAVIDRAGQENGCRYAGFSNPGDQRIVVSPELKPDHEAETILHEVLHQCLRAANVDPDDLAQAGVKKIEEQTIGTLAGVLLDTLRRNPDLVQYLLDDGTSR